ncbi:MAG TPA: hypothetical protein VF705_07480 [Longimicrobium sp.]
MAESFFLHFPARPEEVEPALDAVATATGRAWEWTYPKNADEPTLVLYRYDEVLREYEPETLERILAALGGPPPCTVAAELRRAVQRRAADDADTLTRGLLQRLGGVVVDVLDQCWTRAEIEHGVAKEGGRFMDEIRTR